MTKKKIRNIINSLVYYIKIEKAQGKYQVKARCKNCNYQKKMYLKSGKSVTRSECPNCKCKTLQKEKE